MQEALSFISNVRANIKTNTPKSEMPSVFSFTEYKQVFPFLQLQITANRRNNTTNATSTKTPQQPKGELSMVNTLQSNLLIKSITVIS